MIDSKAGTQREVSEKRAKGKHEGKKSPKIAIFLVAAAVLLVSVIVWMRGTQERSIYQTIVSKGYTGTQEQWLASLVGETADDETKTAYTLAVANGYKGSEAAWNRTLTGITGSSNYANTYALARENGFDKTLTEWLTEISDDPENLGVSTGDGKKTEYELACEYGYSGTFIEWLVSVAYDRVYD